MTGKPTCFADILKACGETPASDDPNSVDSEVTDLNPAGYKQPGTRYQHLIGKCAQPFVHDACRWEGKDNCKQLVFEYASRNHVPIEFNLLDDSGPPGHQMFVFEVELDGRKYPPGIAGTKQDAKTRAAEFCIETMLNEGTYDKYSIRNSVNKIW